MRISGPRAEEVLKDIFVPCRPLNRFVSHRLYYGKIVTSQGQTLDEVLVAFMKGPRSYTREDVAEIHCHGGSVVLRQVLDLVLERGPRLAKPGEFTLRAFLNGRLDLAQAEAVIELIRSRSDSAASLALRQMEGTLSRFVHGLSERIADSLALVEAYVDFPEEDIELPVVDQLLADMGGVVQEVERLLDTFDSGRVLREGLSVLILGRPNVGKSSLLNALLGEARAIVTEIPGTTRDTIEEQLVLGGVPLRLVDTAGVRDTSDPVESEGVRRARAKAGTADLVLLVIDGSVAPNEEDLLAYRACSGRPTILVVNKADLGQVELAKPFCDLTRVGVSAQQSSGIQALQQAIVEKAGFGSRTETRESVVISDRRHREALLACRRCLAQFIEQGQGGASPEFLSLELQEALAALGQITGETTPDDILERIFERFCIGK
ncbi:tRNA modification GTPase MnmE [Desulfuromonas versatilis]|uniref:tRNA modification GTPase MnmE n=1 Tax=Desulfuromonas versatilis TaxID=2802975 RepID=A0ABN6DRT1_9BACT|nr:tRNA modification GTPase MnmE [Desulfuromonas versatilis]